MNKFQVKNKNLWNYILTSSAPIQLTVSVHPYQRHSEIFQLISYLKINQILDHVFVPEEAVVHLTGEKRPFVKERTDLDRSWSGVSLPPPPVSTEAGRTCQSPPAAARCSSGRRSCCSRRSPSQWISCRARLTAASPDAPSPCFLWPGTKGNTGLDGRRECERERERKKRQKGWEANNKRPQLAF